MFEKAFGKQPEFFPVQQKPRRHFVSAEFVEHFRAAAQSFDKIKPLNASSASFADSILVEPNHNRGSMISSGNPRCHNAQHSLMPAASANDDGGVAHRIWPILYFLYRQVKNLLFHFLALAILPVELCCEHRCLVVITREQQA